MPRALVVSALLACLASPSACSDEPGGTPGTGASGGVAGTGGAAGTGNTIRCEEEIATPPPCDAPTQFFKSTMSCGNIACHSERAIGAKLDLASPCVARRLIGVMSDPAEKCAGRILLELGNPAGSLFVNKLGPQPVCGVQMPNTGNKLTPEQVACITNWVVWLAQNQ